MKTASAVVKAVCILHNYTLEKEDPDVSNLGVPEQAVPRHILPRRGQGRIHDNALQTREMFVTYFNDIGAVP